MKNKRLVLWASAALLGLSSLSAQAVEVGLFEYGFNLEGTVTTNAAPAGVDLSSFDTGTGLGSITATITGVGAHSFDAFFDHEIDEVINTYFNESGAADGVAAAGQSWEIDEPGYFDGDIFLNFQDSLLDDGIGTSVFANTAFPDDVSMAMGWDFTLGVDETAIITLLLSATDNGGGFFLTHSDADSAYEFYLSSTLQINGGQVPEPATIFLMGIGLLGLVASRRKVFKV